MVVKLLEVTLAILKPSTVSRPHVVEAVVSNMIQNQLYIIRRHKLQLTRETAGLFYKEHDGKFFYNRLITYMSSGPIIPMVLCGNDAINTWRTIMGGTKVSRTRHEAPDTIRGAYGISDTRNVTHGSDAPETALKEIKFFFPDFSVSEWLEKEEPCYRTKDNIYFDEEEGIHLCVKR